jgi:hypothetical protein
VIDDQQVVGPGQLSQAGMYKLIQAALEPIADSIPWALPSVNSRVRQDVTGRHVDGGWRTRNGIQAQK